MKAGDRLNAVTADMLVRQRIKPKIPYDAGAHRALQDCLKHTHQLTDGGEGASNNWLAKAMHLRLASVTGMLQRLAQTEPRASLHV